MRRWAGTAIAAGAVLVGAFTARAGDNLPDNPAPAECRVAPITAERVAAIFATPLPPPLPPALQTAQAALVTPTPFALPRGEPVDAETADSVRDTIRALVACLNSGDERRAFGLYSDDLLFDTYAPLIAAGYLTADEIAGSFDSGDRLPVEDWITLLSVDRIVRLDDGRVSAVVAADDPTTEGEPVPVLFFLVEDGSRWRIDGVIPRGDAEPPWW